MKLIYIKLFILKYKLTHKIVKPYIRANTNNKLEGLWLAEEFFLDILTAAVISLPQLFGMGAVGMALVVFMHIKSGVSDSGHFPCLKTSVARYSGKLQTDRHAFSLSLSRRSSQNVSKYWEMWPWLFPGNIQSKTYRETKI